MSRRRGEFEHRTSIFEGAFRAWSHLGGLEPTDLESKAASELDPLTNPIECDGRISTKGGGGNGEGSGTNPDGSKRREYPYEPLPRSGLAHPYVQAILSPWLGPDADNEAIQLGLTTLRTWWQHRRRGESGSAIAALGTEKMKGVVEGYTRHFFTLAHCLITNDKEQPPRTLHAKMKDLEKIRSKRNKKRAKEDEDTKITTLALQGGFASDQSALTAGINADLTDTTLSPLERLHAAQRRQLEKNGPIHSSLSGGGGVNNNNTNGMPPMGPNSMGPTSMSIGDADGKHDLPNVVESVNHQANQLAHRGAGGAGGAGAVGMDVGGAGLGGGLGAGLGGGLGAGLGAGLGGGAAAAGVGVGGDSAFPSTITSGPTNPSHYGDPTTTPVVFVSENGDIQIAMTVEGITCAHCVKIVETVLRGCNGNKSPIDGLLDAAADRALCMVLIKIDKSSSAKRVAFEAARNLAMVGYTAKAKEMSVVSDDAGADRKATMDLGALSTAFDIVANTDAKDVFNWNIACTCPDNGVLREDCARHSQMNTRIFEAFDLRERKVQEYMAGCGQKYGMACTCGPNCRCTNCSQDCKQNLSQNQMKDEPLSCHQEQQQQQQQQQQFQDQTFPSVMVSDNHGLASLPQQAMLQQQQQQSHPQPPQLMAQQSSSTIMSQQHQHQQQHQPQQQQHQQPQPLDPFFGDASGSQPSPESGAFSRRNNSIISFGNNLRSMSVTSETTFGRAMSGLSALSIDWETLEDFDINVDHSSHINNNLSSLNNANLQGGLSSLDAAMGGVGGVGVGVGMGAVGSMAGNGAGVGGVGVGGVGGIGAVGTVGGVGGVGVVGGPGGMRRSSLRKPFVPGDPVGEAHVSFKV